MKNINLKTLRLLVMMENSPRCAQQLVRQAPEAFGADPNGRLTISANVYKTLGHAERDGLIRRDAAYRPPSVLTDQIRGRVIWWTPTDQGRAILNEWRQVLKPVPVTSPTMTVLAGKKAAARRKIHASQKG